MNPTVAEALALALAETEQVTAPREGELGYGRDLACVVDVADDFREVLPNTPRIIAQAIARRLQTPRGTLSDDRDYGYDLRGRLHVGLTQQQLRLMQSQIVGEALKDERVETVTTTVNYDGHTINASLLVTPRDPRIEPFSFVLRVTDAAVLIDAVGS